MYEQLKYAEPTYKQIIELSGHSVSTSVKKIMLITRLMLR